MITIAQLISAAKQIIPSVPMDFESAVDISFDNRGLTVQVVDRATWRSLSVESIDKVDRNDSERSLCIVDRLKKLLENANVPPEQYIYDMLYSYSYGSEWLTINGKEIYSGRYHPEGICKGDTCEWCSTED